jgi:hypothetical protein
MHGATVSGLPILVEKWAPKSAEQVSCRVTREGAPAMQQDN